LGVKHAVSGTNGTEDTANGWMYIPPGASKDTTLGSLTFEGRKFYACDGPNPNISTIAAIPTDQTTTGKCFEQIQLIGQEVTA
jgi:hypothetical protein